MSWLRKRKKYSRPKKPFDKIRIDEEKEVAKKYGLKNKTEIWKANSAIERIRGMAKKLITSSVEDQEKLLGKLKKQGFKVGNIADVLALNRENWLERRLQTIIIKKGLAKTAKGARQLITHKHVSVNKRIVNIPSYMVEIDEEEKIDLVLPTKVKKEDIPKEDIKLETKNE